ncbi:MAG: TetR/AcrR family transcriptional regulator [Dehalococcoidia bacterium]
MTETTTPAPVRDGRAERGERTHDAVVSAMLDLIETGDLRPTAPRIAERAGVSLRTVFHHFEDLEALFATGARRQMQRHLTDLRRVRREGGLADRIDALVASRASALEVISPVRRSALSFEPSSPVIARHLSWIRGRGRLEIEKVFAIELKRLPPAARRDVTEALTAAASWSTWEALRAHQGLSIAQARRVMKRMLSALLEQG